MSNRKTLSDPFATIPRDQHSISRQSISEAALKVLYRLDKSGHRACLVGGGVRDLLLEKRPKDFDVATDATPEQVRELFRNSRIIGRRFRLVHIRFGREIIEVATFRGQVDGSEKTQLSTEGRILRDNTFGDIKDDAIRRDFTINAIYYDISDFSVLDYSRGLEDIETRTLRLIGDATTRYQEDPVRMLRAIRFSAKLDFQVEENAAKSIFECGHMLSSVPAARLFDETIKLFHCGNASRVFELLRHYQLLQYLFPVFSDWIKAHPEAAMLDFIDQALVNTDIRINRQQHVSQAFIFAVMLWPVVHHQAKMLQAQAMKPIAALVQAADDVLSQQLKAMSIPRRHTQTAKDIWSYQPRFQRTQGKHPMRLLGLPNFRAAYDFMHIQSMVGLEPYRLCQWWTEFQKVHSPPEKIRRPIRNHGKQRKSKKNVS